MKKKLLLLMVVIPTLMCLFAFASSAKITIYAGADSSTEATEYEASSITLTGNTEANETVTVYFTDDGRAWKAGETVTFTTDTNLYTIECTKISTAAEYNAATGGGNYILMADINNANNGPINGQNCTTRIFMNGKHFTIGNASHTMIKDNCHSFYLLGEGYVSSVWGGSVFVGALSNKNADVTWLIGKDITIETNKDGSSLFSIYNAMEIKSLNLHIYGTIIKNQSGNIGIWSLINIPHQNSGTDYNIYFHEGSSVELTGRIVNCGKDGSTEGLGNIVFDGGDVTLLNENYFYGTPAGTPFVGTVTVNGGTFNIANADTMTAFKNSIVENKKAQDIDATSFKVVCKECAFTMVLGDDFKGLANDFTIDSYCPNCKTRESKEVKKVFEALGYSIKENGEYGIIASYQINKESLAEYEKYLQTKGKTLEFGVFMANSETFGENNFILANGSLGTQYGFRTKITDRDYNRVDCIITDFTSEETALPLIFSLYTIEGNEVSYIQRDGEYAGTATQGGITLNVVTFERVAEILGKTDIEILPPPSNEDE